MGKGALSRLERWGQADQEVKRPREYRIKMVELQEREAGGREAEAQALGGGGGGGLGWGWDGRCWEEPQELSEAFPGFLWEHLGYWLDSISPLKQMHCEPPAIVMNSRPILFQLYPSHPPGYSEASCSSLSVHLSVLCSTVRWEIDSLHKHSPVTTVTVKVFWITPCRVYNCWYRVHDCLRNLYILQLFSQGLKRVHHFDRLRASKPLTLLGPLGSFSISSHF